MLVRRGVRHGAFVPGPLGAPRSAAELADDWRAGRPILLRGLLAAGVARRRSTIEASRRAFERLRDGAELEPFLERRLAAIPAARRARLFGASEDLADPTEVVKVHAALPARGGARRGVRELYAKLSWTGDDERETSLRIRFSFGDERTGAWRGDERASREADEFAEQVFPECAVLARHGALLGRLARLAGGPVRLSERIVYNNAPGGGASFHHDAETGQLGVVYGQLVGSTAWLALPREELAEELARVARGTALARRLGTPERAFRVLEDQAPAGLARLLESDPRLTRRVAARGALCVLRRGDVLILPSPDRAHCAWHAVFALGRRASVAHSYGLFRSSSRA